MLASCDTEDPYGDDFLDFSGLLTSIPFDANDSPARALTRFTDYDFVDALCVDDRAEMYLVYYSGNNPHNPPIQRPLGKYAWKWGGLVVFDGNGSGTVHQIRSTNPVLQSPPSAFPLQKFPAEQEAPCPDGSPYTNNRIDSSRELVKYYFLDILRRNPDGPGWDGWTSNIAQCVFYLNCNASRRSSTALGFFWSAEFIQKMSQIDPNTGMPIDAVMASPPGSPNFNASAYNRRFVWWCYDRFLRREPESQATWDAWTNVLNSNGDYAGLVYGFIYSPEYRSKLFQ